jgi:MFS family permease
MTPRTALGGYLLVTLCYWAFTLSDGALRMLVLLHLHDRGQTAWALALVLIPYEVAGVVTNLLGGYLGARFGLRPTLSLGLLLQAAACAMLAADAATLSVTYVAVTQVLSGVAKDLAKTSAKSYVKALQPTADGARLFRWVAWLTGSKNTMKGLGFFAGGALLAWIGFGPTNRWLAAALAGCAALAFVTLPRVAGRRGAAPLDVLRQDAAMGWLAAARVFLFGARDAWFAVAVPLFLVGRGWTPVEVGAFLAGWVVVYGVVQSQAPRLTQVSRPADGARLVARWTAALLLPLLPAALLLPRGPDPTVVAAVALCVFGGLFAVTSSLHSWLVVALHDDHRGPERVGFYYAANAVGRLLGTALSGALFGAVAAHGDVDAGLAACLYAACVAACLAVACTSRLTRTLDSARASSSLFVSRR